MTIDEAIKHAKEKAKEQMYYANFERGSNFSSCIKCAGEHEQLAKWLEELKEYKELEEQGLLLKLPCKVGTTAYVVGTRCLAGEEPEEGCTFLDCEECIYDKTYTVFERKVDNMMMYHFLVGDNENFIFNKTVFLTKEAAEAKLKEIERKKLYGIKN